jgi:acetolactate synthase-1/2/3 large subunit
VQWAEFNRKSEQTNLSAELDFSISQSRIKAPSGDFVELVESLEASKLPLIWVGNGVRLAGAEKLLNDFLGKWSLPFVTTWGMKDFGSIHPDSHLGTIGPFGQRGANMAVFSSDLLVVLGSHLSITQTSQVTAGYASNAKIIVIDIDQNELDQLQVEVSMRINADVGGVLASLVEAAPTNNSSRGEGWDIPRFQKMNGVEDRELTLSDTKNGFVNSDLFLSRFFKTIDFEHNVVIDGGGTALYSGFQSELSGCTKRILCSTAMSSMGTGLAEALGALKVDPIRTIVIIGDGSFWMNAMDVVTAVQQQLPLTILVINNGGYLAIRHTQESFLGSRFYGTSPNWGLTFPKLEDLANALGLHYSRITSLSQIGDLAADLGERVGVSLVEVMTPDDQPNLFKQATLRNEDGRVEALALRDMWPFVGGESSSLKDAS